MTDIDPGGSDDRSHQDLLKRQAALAETLRRQRERLEPAKANAASGGVRGAADGMKLASEFVAGILAGAGIGYLLDRILGTGPFGLIVFLLLGFVAGVLNVLRSVGKSGGSAGGDRKEATNRENAPPE